LSATIPESVSPPVIGVIRVLAGIDGVAAVLTLRAGRQSRWQCPPIRCGGRGSRKVSLVILTGVCLKVPETARRSSVAAGSRGGPAGCSVTGDDGRDGQPEPALGLVRQAGPEPARNAPGQGGHDDLVELMIGEHLFHGFQRAGAAEIALDGGAQPG
jgi:hypothetical protein